jgi:hypothetical protein
VSAYACSIYALKYGGGRDYFPLRINIGEAIELRQEADNPEDPDAVAAFHEGVKLGYLAREKQAIWNAIESQPHRVVVIGKLFDEDGELVSLDVEISIIERRNQPSSAGAAPGIKPRMRGAWRGGKLRSIAVSLAVLIAAFVIGNQVSISNGNLRNFAYWLCCSLPKQIAASAGIVNQQQPPADLFEDISSKPRDRKEDDRRQLAKVPQELQRMYISLSYRQLADEAASREKINSRKVAEDLSMKEQADELWRKSQEATARRLVEQQKRRAEEIAAERRAKEMSEKNLAMRELNDRELMHRRRQMAVWEAESLALQEQADELRRKSQETTARRLAEQQKGRAEELAAQRLAKELSEKNLAMPKSNEGEPMHRLVPFDPPSAKASGPLQAAKMQKKRIALPKPRAHKKITLPMPKWRKKAVQPVLAGPRWERNFSRHSQESNNALCKARLYKRCYY